MVRDKFATKKSSVRFEGDTDCDTSIGTIESNSSTHFINIDTNSANPYVELPLPTNKTKTNVIDIIQTEASLKTYDMFLQKKRAYEYVQLNYPPNTKNNTRVLSFRFGIENIVLFCLGVELRFFDMLKLVLDPGLLYSCVDHVKAILRDKHTVDEYIDSDLTLAYNLLRDKHVLSVITKVMLLPLICCLFPDIQTVPCVMKGLLKGKHVDVLVRAEQYSSVGEVSFNDIERVDPVAANNQLSIDYFV